MKHPLAAIPPGRRLAVFLPLLVLSVVVMAVFQATGAPLTTSAAPQGIVSFELAGSAAKAQEIVASWNDNARLRASFGLGLDYLFMPLYSTTIALACIWTAAVLGARRWPLAGAGTPLAWGLCLAALLDVIENVALVAILWNGSGEPWPQVSFWCASVKFALILLGLIYALYGAVAAHSRRLAT